MWPGWAGHLMWETHRLSWSNPEPFRSPREPVNPVHPYIQMQKPEVHGGPRGPAVMLFTCKPQKPCSRLGL